MTSNLFVGHNVIRLKEIDSTNNYSRQLVREGNPVEGTIVVAEEQTKGRGQRNNSWISQVGLNLTCSYIFRPTFLAAKNQFSLSASVAMALFDVVCEVLASDNVTVKWPNDILVENRKIAGILIENSLRGMHLDSSIVGIGLNVNQVGFDADLNATSLTIESGSESSIQSVLTLLNIHLEKRYLKLREGKHEEILNELNRNLFAYDRSQELTINGLKETVIVRGARPSGELQLEHANGSNTLHQHHEIEWNLS